MKKPTQPKKLRLTTSTIRALDDDKLVVIAGASGGLAPCGWSEA